MRQAPPAGQGRIDAVDTPLSEKKKPWVLCRIVSKRGKALTGLETSHKAGDWFLSIPVTQRREANSPHKVGNSREGILYRTLHCSSLSASTGTPVYPIRFFCLSLGTSVSVPHCYMEHSKGLGEPRVNRLGTNLPCHRR